MNNNTQRLELFIASFIGLYFEMLIVRWLASEVRLFSYFKNITMMAAFLGLGIGFALAKNRRDLIRFFIPFLLLYVPLVLVISQLTGSSLIVPESGEYLWRPSALPTHLSTILFTLIVIMFFLYTLGLFIPLGQLIGRLMIGIKPLSAYMINIVGSLVGIWVFAAVSYFQLNPWVWFFIGVLFVLWLLRESRRVLMISSISSILLLVILVIARKDTIWSPYYRVDIVPIDVEGKKMEPLGDYGYEMFVNQIGHMTAVNLTPEFLDKNSDYAQSINPFNTIYNLPYKLIQPDRVLVIGAGTGNDVAAALRHGTNTVDAVEIDPLIFEIANKMHPEHPYSSTNVKIFIDDARAFLEKTDQQYDLIVFGILDSQTMLSGMSNVRLDNFVYTLESLEQARARLSENGVIALTFFSERWWIKQRLAQSLQEVFDESPIQLVISDTPWVMFLSGLNIKPEKLDLLCEEIGCIRAILDNKESIPFATDDWPYLYLKDRRIPLPYWIVLGIVIITAWVSTRKVFPGSRGMDWHFFFLGGAFLLIEFKIITELALLFGSTWIVNAIAVSAVLVMVLFANLLIANLKRVNMTLLYVFLMVSLILGYIIPLEILLPYGNTARVLLASILMGTPLFFASAIFASSLKHCNEVPLAFASNFFGSAVGGVLEYASLALGISSLYVIGAGLYVASWITRSFGK